MTNDKYEVIDQVEEAIDDIEVIDEVVEEDPIVEDRVIAITVFGAVSNCSNLNIRVKPEIGAEVVWVAPSGTKLEIDASDLTGEWYHVFTESGMEGYAMKQYITIE